MNRFFPIIFFLLLLALAWWSYHPGLSGAFLFDDFNNLPQLGAYGPVNNLRTLLLYLTSGQADPTGRPLSLLSFLVDANNWPADPAPFKRTSVLLHLFNGILLALVLLKLGLGLGIDKVRAQAAAALAAGLWMLHPLLVSTTLYVVQREAMLPATFTLLGMLLWLAGRARHAEGRAGGLLLMVLGAWGCAALAVLCKANGVLLPLLLLVMEWSLDRGNSASPDAGRQHQFRRVKLWLLGMPSAALLAWLLTKLPAAFTGETFSRPWTLAQRLITEPRVVCDYLQLLWIPRASGSSLFNDSYRASTDLLHPWTTLPAIAVIGALLVLGFASRRRHPALSFAILFYFAGHVLESTLIPLELYFEHRNYLPALPMFWPLALWLTGDRSLRTVRIALFMVLPVIMAWLCHTRAEIWGKPLEQALLLAEIDPESPRAQANAASYETSHGRPDLAILRLRAAISKTPDEPQFAFNLLNAECATGDLTPDTLAEVNRTLRQGAGLGSLVHDWLVNVIAVAAGGECRGLDLPAAETMVKAASQNLHYSKNASYSSGVMELEGRIALAHEDGATALRDFNASLSAFPTPDGALLHAALLGSAGFSPLGIQHLEYYKTLSPADRHPQAMVAIHLWLLDKDGYWSSEFAHMESELRADSTSKGQETMPAPASPKQ